MNKRALLVFAKAPIAGHAKTRLIPKLGSAGAANLHQKLVRHTLDTLSNSNYWDTLLWCAGDMEHNFFRHCSANYDLKLFSQQGDDLGQRMYNAAKFSLQNYDSICIVGTDCPMLKSENISQAFDALKHIDVAFNPAEDGGYILIATNSIERNIFEGIQWGTSQVMTQSLGKAKQLNLNVKLLDTLWDVDIPEDLERPEMQAFLTDISENTLKAR